MSGPTVQLNAVKFEDKIRRRGRIVKWQEAIVCSCVNMDSGSPDYNCEACKGLGQTYAEPVEDLALIQSIVHSKAFEETVGAFELGDAMMTVGHKVPATNPATGYLDATKPGRLNPLFHVGMYDIITLTDDVYKTSEVLVKGQNIYARPADTLLNVDVLDVTAIRTSDRVTGVITSYEQGTDYVVEGNVIKWVGDNQPMYGEQYSVQYTHRPSFIVLVQLPTQRYQDKQELPRSVVLRYRAGGFDRQ